MKYKVSNESYIYLVNRIRGIFSEATHKLHDGRNKIKVISFSGQDIVIKSFKVPHIINKFAYTFFRKSKAQKSYDNSLKIEEFVPKPIAYIEFTKFGLLYDSYFLCEKFHYNFTIREPLLDKDFKDKKVIFKQFAEFTYGLHEKGIEHLDYSPGNILIQKKEGGYLFKIIDINRMVFRKLTLNDRLKNFAKLWAKEEDLQLIIESYALLVDTDPQESVLLAQKYSQKHKDRKNFKKRLKGKKVVD